MKPNRKEILNLGPVSIAPEYREEVRKDADWAFFEQAVLLGYDGCHTGSPMNYGLRFKSRKLNICMENGKYLCDDGEGTGPQSIGRQKWFYYDSPVMAISEEEAQNMIIP